MIETNDQELVSPCIGGVCGDDLEIIDAKFIGSGIADPVNAN